MAGFRLSRRVVAESSRWAVAGFRLSRWAVAESSRWAVAASELETLEVGDGRDFGASRWVMAETSELRGGWLQSLRLSRWVARRHRTLTRSSYLVCSRFFESF